MKIDFDLIYKILAIIEQLAGHPQAPQLKAAALAQLNDLEVEVAKDNAEKAEAEAKKKAAEDAKAAAEAAAEAKKAEAAAAKQERAHAS